MSFAEAGLSEDTLFEIIKYIYERKKQPNNDSDLKSFVQNGVSFEFFMLMITCEKMPKRKINPLTKKENNLWTIDHICEFEARDLDYVIDHNDINGPNYARIIELVLRSVYFKEITKKVLVSKSNELFNTIGLEIHKEKELYNELYVVRLLHILTNHEIQLVDKFNDFTEFENHILPIFKKYHIPYFLNSHSFEFDQIQNTRLQYFIIFDRFKDTIKKILNEKELDKVGAFMKEYNERPISNVFIRPDEEEEILFLSFVNIICKDLGLKCFTFDDLIEEGFIPKILMHLLHIDSIKNVTDIDSTSIDVQIKNIESIVDFIRKDDPSINYYLFDFQSERSFSVRLLLKFIFDTYFLKSSREELISRYFHITEGIQKRKYPNEDQLTDIQNMMKLPYFIVTGKTNCNFDQRSKAYDFCMKHNIPLIMKFTNFKNRSPDHFYLYQLQIFYNIIDNERKSLHCIETLKYVLHELHKLRVPRISTIAISIKAKNVILDQNEEQEKQELINQEEEDEEDIEELPIKMNQNPTTIKDRLKELSNIETPEQFWNSDKLFQNARFENGILISEELSNIEIQKAEDNKSQDLTKMFTSNSRYCKLFYYNEETKKWIINSEELKKNEEKHFVCCIDSIEKDLISFASNVIRGDHPNLDDENQIFVYGLEGRYEFSNLGDGSLFLFIHVPEEKKNLPNIKTIIIQIYAFLSFVCDIKIIILDKTFYEIQVKNMLTVFNIVDKNIEKIRKKIEDEDKEKENDDNYDNYNNYINYDSDNSDNNDDSDNDNSDNDNKDDKKDDKKDDDDDYEYEDNYGKNEKIIKLMDNFKIQPYNIHKGSSFFRHDEGHFDNCSYTIFLINDDSINTYDAEMNDQIINNELFTSINSMFDNRIIMNIININNNSTYDLFSRTFNSIRSPFNYDYYCRDSKFQYFDKYIEDVSLFSSRYILIKQKGDDQLSGIRSIDHDALSAFEMFSPKFDINFNTDCKNILSEINSNKVSFDFEILKNQLNKSATENLEYLNYLILKVVFPGLKQLEKLKMMHLSFLKKEYLEIIKILVGEKFAYLAYFQHIGILNKQIEKDKLRIQDVFSPMIKKIQKKNTPKEESFEDVKQKGTSYIMKETESVREIKVTLEMKDDLRSIIEQDF